MKNAAFKKVYAAGILFLFFNTSLFCQSQDQGIEVYIESILGRGFFAELNNIMATIIEFDKYPTKYFVVNWKQQFFPYKDDPASNGWDLFFEFKGQDAIDRSIAYKRSGGYHNHTLHDQTCMDRWVNYEKYLPYRKYVCEKFNQYVQIKQPIVDEVEHFFNQRMQGRFCIGVHVRFAGVHVGENPDHKKIEIKEYINEARAQYVAHRTERPILFVASDSNYVIDEFKKAFKLSDVVCINAFRAAYNEDPHLIFEHADYYFAHPKEFHKDKPGSFGGKTALMDCLLLAKCNVMIHSQSNVCEWVTFFNPYIKSIFLPKGFKSRPCKFPNAPFHVVQE